MAVKTYLMGSTSVIPLALFRIFFGAVMFFEMGRLIWSPLGDIKHFNPIFQFKYPLFEWVVQGPDWFMTIVMWTGTIAAASLMVGLFFRISSVLVFLIYTYLFLIDITFWNNHYYLYTLFAGLLIFTNAHGGLSIDRVLSGNPKDTFRWQVWIFKVQIVLVYFYGGISKLVNPDWLDQTSVKLILSNAVARNGIEITEPFMSWLVFIQTFGGIGFDLLIGFMLLYRRTFVLALILSMVFHLTNFHFLNIGSFPLAMIGTLVLFVPESFWLKWRPETTNTTPGYDERHVRVKGILIAVYLGIQVALPLRHFFYEGNVFWTAEGKLGAWHMMSGSTEVEAKYFYLYETDAKTGDTLSIQRLETDKFLTAKQIRTLGKWPFLIPSFANFLKEEAELAGMQNVLINADIFMSRNGHRPKPIVDPKVNLCALERRAFGHNDWILLYAEEHY